ETHRGGGGPAQPRGARPPRGAPQAGGGSDRPAGAPRRQDQPALRPRADRPVPGRSVPPARERARSEERAMIGRWLELRRLAVIGSALVGAALVTVVPASAGESLQVENAWV